MQYSVGTVVLISTQLLVRGCYTPMLGSGPGAKFSNIQSSYFNGEIVIIETKIIPNVGRDLKNK